MKPRRNASEPARRAGGVGDRRSGIRRAAAAALAVAAAGALVWGVARLGDAARDRVGPRNRYAVRFADVGCDPPPGLDRATFLAEVRYASNAPDTVQSLDPDLHAKLAAAFAAHPWVAGFDEVTVDPDGTVRVRLRYRTPALAVRTADGSVRVVDGDGVLLPAGVSADGLPVLATPVPVPATPAGRAWDDAAVRRAVRLAGAHRPRRLERTPDGWRLTAADGKTLVVGE